MDAGLIAFIAGMIGLLVGVLSMNAVARSEREQERSLVSAPALRDGAAQVLAVIGRAYLVIDEVGGVVQASPGAYAMGLVRGHTVASDELADMIRTVRHRGIFAERTFEIDRGEGEALVLDVRVASLGDEYILVLADDRTEISRVQRMRNDFVANVSHELKTPVGAVSLLAEAIEQASDGPEAIEYFVGRLHKETRRLSALVRDIIELSRLQSTDVIARGGPVSVPSLVADAVDRSHIVAEEKDIQISTRIEEVPEVYGDAELLGIAVQNLVENAVRYSPEHTKVDEVADQGVGIPEDEQKRIFERFYRVDPARSRQTGGTGLGLSIVKHVMTQHGGSVTVRSMPQEGSTFTLALPLNEPPAAV